MRVGLFSLGYLFIIIALCLSCDSKKKDDRRDREGEQDAGGPSSPGALAIESMIDIKVESGNTLMTFEGNVLPADGTSTPGTLTIDSSSSFLAQTPAGSKTNIIAVTTDGQGYVPVTSEFDVDVMFSALHPSGKELFIALHADRESGSTEYNPKSTSDLIANLNCSLLRISLEDDSRDCVKLGVAVIDPPYAHLQRNLKAVQFDGEGNVYFLAGEFARCTGDGGQTQVDHEEPAQDGEHFTFCGGIEQGLIHHLNYETGEVKVITQDTTRVSFFSVLQSGEVVYQVRDETQQNTGFGSPAILSLYKNGQTINLSGASPVGISFFATDTDRTVMWGDQDAGGIRFARTLDDNRVTSAIILNSDIGAAPFGNIIPSPISTINGDDGHLYVLYNVPNPSSSTVYRYSVLQVMPYEPSPLVTFESSQMWIDWVESGNSVQVSNGYLFYVENVDLQDGFGFRDVIRIIRISDRTVTTLFAETSSRFKIYNWQLNNNKLTFSGLDLTKTNVIVGTIDVNAVKNGEAADTYLTLSEVASAANAQSQIKDIEVLLPSAPITDPGEEPIVQTFTADPDTALSLSLAFNKSMNKTLTIDGVSITDSQSNSVEALPLWIYKTLHLIPDLDGLFGMDQTTPLASGSQYTVSLNDNIKDIYDQILGGTKEFTLNVLP